MQDSMVIEASTDLQEPQAGKETVEMQDSVQGAARKDGKDHPDLMAKMVFPVSQVLKESPGSQDLVSLGRTE